MSVSISIVVPVYNAESFIKSCLDSIFSQTFRDFELICINDGSSDRSLDILRDYAARYSNIIVIDQNNSGIGVSTNIGIDRAKGKYFYQMDHDDSFVNDNALQIMYDVAEKYDLDILSFNYKTSVKISKLKQPSNKLISGKEFLVSESYHPALWNKLLKMEYLKSINFRVREDLRFVDIECYPRLMIGAKRVMHIEDILYFFKIETNHLSVSKTLSNINSATAYYETAKTYDSLACNESNRNLKKVLIKERFKAIIQAIRIISVVDSEEGYVLYNKLFEFDFLNFEKYLMKNENKFFYNTYVKKDKKIIHPWVYFIRKVTKKFI